MKIKMFTTQARDARRRCRNFVLRLFAVFQK